MHAVVEIGGLQYKVAKHERLRVASLEAEVGKTVTLKNVLLTTDEKGTRVGRPLVDGARVGRRCSSTGWETRSSSSRRSAARGTR